MRKKLFIFTLLGALAVSSAHAASPDINNSGTVDIQDLGILLSNWNRTGTNIADLNENGAVDIQDLGILLSAWGTRPTTTPTPTPTSTATPTPTPSPTPPSTSFTGYSLAYGTFWGGSSDIEQLREPVLRSDGALIFGGRAGVDMPQWISSGAIMTSRTGGVGDSYIGILSSQGSFLAGTYFGGSDMERYPYGIRILSNGDIAWLTGSDSNNIPYAANSWLSSPATTREGDGFACRFSADLKTARWCTYLGLWPRGGMMTDSNDNIYAMGRDSVDYLTPTTGTYRSSFSDPGSYMVKIQPDGKDVGWIAAMGGDGPTAADRDLPLGAAISNNNIIVTGLHRSSAYYGTTNNGSTDSFLASFSSDMRTRNWVRFIRGSQTDHVEHPLALAQDGSIFIAGITQTSGLANALNTFHGGANDGFLQKYDQNGNLIWSRYIGGSNNEHILGPAIGPNGLIYIYGQTSSRDITTSANALSRQFKGGTNDGLFMVLDQNGNVLYTTYLGGSGDEHIRGAAIGPAGEVWLIGRTGSSDLPVTTNAHQRTYGGSTYDGMILKLQPQ